MAYEEKIISITLSCAVVLGLSITAFAASGDFAATLPAHQGDTEVSTIRKETEAKNFSITIDSIGTGTDKVVHGQREIPREATIPALIIRWVLNQKTSPILRSPK